MTNLYLILHKVRGAPAFDVAIPTTIGDEAAWIIPTSGHRAYPWWSIKLEGDNSLLYKAFGDDSICELPPPNWPDHYSANLDSPKPFTIPGLLAKLGLGSKPIKRRRID